MRRPYPVSYTHLDKAILGELASYRQEVTDALKKDVKTVAKECAAEIKEGSPYLTGSYKKGWQTKLEFESDDDIRITCLLYTSRCV